MLLLNVTVKVHESIAEDWLTWAKEEHVAEMIATKCFTKATVLRLMDLDEQDGPTYSIQFFAENRAAYETYLENHAADMLEKSFKKWGDRFIAFRTLMEIVH